MPKLPDMLMYTRQRAYGYAVGSTLREGVAWAVMQLPVRLHPDMLTCLHVRQHACMHGLNTLLLSDQPLATTCITPAADGSACAAAGHGQ